MVQEELTSPTRTLGPLLALVGATASGKSAVALRLAGEFPLEIVNADAFQFYVGMDIGTAKPSAGDMAAVPHHLFDVAPPDQPLNAGRYVEMADDVIAGILRRGKLPLLVGGTGMYVRILLRGLAAIPDVPPAIRAKVLADLERRGPGALHEQLAEVDPDAAKRIGPNDSQRITRALEVFDHTGRTITSFQQAHRFLAPRYDYLKLGLKVDREWLKGRIRLRVAQMFEAGFPAEVRTLLERGYGPEQRAFKALGYREVMAQVRGEASRQEAIDKVTKSHLMYAKRQGTWFRGEEDVVWCPEADFEGLRTRVAAFTKQHLEPSA